MSAILDTAPADTKHDDRKHRLRELDGCLDLLEDAHERDELLVSPELSARLRPSVPAVAAGMPIAAALDLVFREQEEHLPPDDPLPLEDVRPRPQARPAPSPAVVAAAEPGDEALDERSARFLTERIRVSTNQVSLLLLEAHEGRAWHALGYRGWEAYVRRELGMGRSRSYELLDHARLIRCVRAITGMTTVPHIPPYTARLLKQQMPEFVAALHARTEGRPREEMRALVGELIRDARWRDRAVSLGLPRLRLTPAGAADDMVEAARALRASIDCLAAMPPASNVVDRMRVGVDEGLTNLERALQWLSDFADEWSRHEMPEGDSQPLPDE